MPKVLKKLSQIILLFLVINTSANADVLDDLIIKKKSGINRLVIELLAAGLNDQTDNSNPKLAEEICMAGGGSHCTHYAYGPDTIAQAIENIPLKDRTFWWDRFKDQYGNDQWRCRGGQTKQFAENSKCSGVSKDDDRWPG